MCDNLVNYSSTAMGFESQAGNLDRLQKFTLDLAKKKGVTESTPIAERLLGGGCTQRERPRTTP